MIDTTIAFSGHRKIPISKENELAVVLPKILERMYQEGYRTFITGMAWGFDLIAAKAVIDMMPTHEGIHLWAVRPFPEHRDSIPQRYKDIYDIVWNLADFHHTTSTHYGKYSYWSRNMYLVSHARHLICFLDPESSRSGTRQTYNMAVKRNLLISNIY